MGFLTAEGTVRAKEVSTAGKKAECNVNVDMIEKKLSDLNDDCLMEIFTYLTLDDLVHVAEAYSQFEDLHFKNCLRDIFVKKNGHDIFMVNNPKLMGSSMYKMQHFGNLISSLSLLLSEDCHYFDKGIEDCIFKYSRESLINIHIQNIHEYTMYGRLEPFPKVCSVRLVEGKLGKEFSRFNTLFPNLQKLKLDNLEIEDPECIEEHFQFLNHVTVHNTNEIKYENFDWYNDNKRIFTNYNLNLFFKLNPQIQGLSLKHDVDDDAGRYVTGEDGIKLSKEFLCSLQRKLPQLHELELKIMQPGLWNGNRGVHINFPLLHTLQVNVLDWNMLYALPIACKNLNVLHLICKEGLHINYEAIAKVVRNNSSITKLRLFNEADTVFDLRNIQMESPNLSELDILYPTCDSVLLHDLTDFTQFMARYDSLEKLTVYYRSRDEVDHQQFEQTFRNKATENGLSGQWMFQFSTRMSIISYFSCTHLAYYIVIKKGI